MAYECDNWPSYPAASCTASGGTYHQYRYPLEGGGSLSYMVFFSPASIAVFGADVNATLATACQVGVPPPRVPCHNDHQMRKCMPCADILNPKP